MAPKCHNGKLAQNRPKPKTNSPTKKRFPPKKLKNCKNAQNTANYTKNWFFDPKFVLVSHFQPFLLPAPGKGTPGHSTGFAGSQEASVLCLSLDFSFRHIVPAISTKGTQFLTIGH